MKQCACCRKTKRLSAFNLCRTTKTGRQSYCKDCLKAYRKKHRERRNEYLVVYRENNREQLRANNRRWRRRHPDKSHEAQHRWQKANPEKRRANTLVGNAVRDGRLQKAPCELCGAPAEAHHDDYSKPLEVRWLCSLHHKAADAKRRLRKEVG